MFNKNSKLSLCAKFAGGTVRFFAIAVAASTLGILFNFLMPQIVGFTVDSIIGDKTFSLPAVIMKLYDRIGGRQYLRDNLIICSALVVLCAVLSGTFNFVSRSCVARGTETFIANLRTALYKHTQYLPFAWFSTNQTGDTIQRCTSDVETMRRFISQQLLEVVRILILVSMALAIMFSMNVTLTIVVLAFIPVVIVYTCVFFPKISRKFKECDEAEGELTVTVQENLTGVRVVRAFGREVHELERFDKKNNKFASLWESLGLTLGIYWGAGEVVSASQLLAVVVAGTYLASSGNISLGTLIIFISYTQTIMWPVRQLGRIFSDMSKLGVSLGRIKEILDAPREEPEPDSLRPNLDSDIEFKNVNFKFGHENVLEDVSFTVSRGTTLGILGATGAGKSTITYLLNRLYELPQDGGSITIGGVDIRQIDRRHLRKNVGLVLQEPFLFSKTIGENIDIAVRSGDLERIRASARDAVVDESIMSFASDYNTVVGERGVTLSGGQKQRIAIARTLMTNAPIMVFDDSMSSLDMQTDAKIRKALRENTKGATVIIISHRISTLMNADKIIVLDNGKICESGSHAELLQTRDGVYKRVYELQSGV